MRRLSCNAIMLAAAIAIAGYECNAMACDTPKSRLRKPNDAILSEPGRDELGRQPVPTPESPNVASPGTNRVASRYDSISVNEIDARGNVSVGDGPRATGEPNAPSAWIVSSEAPARSQSSLPRVVILGRRDDSREATYALEGIRGQESPAGTTSGRYAKPGLERAGFSQCTSRHAQPGLDRDHSVGYVGGGTPFSWGNRGQARTSQEGTFGMDYSGWLVSRNTWLKWSHGGRYQGGYGRYETDGPRLLPEK